MKGNYRFPNKKLSLKESLTAESLKENLGIIGSITPSELLALEVIWQPEGIGDKLSAEELVTSYPNLRHL